MNNNIFPYLFHHQSYKLRNRNTVRYRALQRAIQFHSTLASCSSALLFYYNFLFRFFAGPRSYARKHQSVYWNVC